MIPILSRALKKSYEMEMRATNNKYRKLSLGKGDPQEHDQQDHDPEHASLAHRAIRLGRRRRSHWSGDRRCYERLDHRLICGNLLWHPRRASVSRARNAQVLNGGMRSGIPVAF